MSKAALLAEIRTQYLDQLTRTAQAAGIASSAGLEALANGAGRFFDAMTAERSATDFSMADDLTASQINLVDDNQLDFSIRLGELSRRLGDGCASSLYKLHQRLVTLLDRPTLKTSDSPVSPEGISKGLADLFATIGEPHQHALDHLIKIETHLLQELPVLYAELNQLLVRQQIAPTRMQPMPSSDRGNSQRFGAANARSDPLATLQQAMLARAQPTGGGSGQFGGDPGQGGAGFAPGGALPPMSPTAVALGEAVFERLLAQLGQLQQPSQGSLFGEPASETAENSLQALKSGEFGASLKVQDAAALDVLATLFDVVFDDPRVSNAVKAAMARLQIPVLKASMLEPAFFSERNHPARLLLDTMGQAAIGLGPDIDGDHPVCVELRRVATAIQTEFDRDSEVFGRYTAELETFMARRSQGLQEQAQGFIALAKRQEERDLAAQQVHGVIQGSGAAAAPPAIADFLHSDWRGVLELALLTGGEQGEAWREAQSVVTDLLWSIQPKADPEERKRLAQLIPGLLRRIRAGLDRVGIAAASRAAFFDACLAVQTSVLRGTVQASPTNPPEATLARKTLGDQETMTTLEMDGLTLKVLRPAAPAFKIAGEMALSLTTGDWVEFRLPDETVVCGRLAWISPILANPLFTNPDWPYAISVAGAILDRQLSSGQATVGSAQSFFDRMAEKALGLGRSA